MDKEDAVYIYNRILSALKNNEMMPFAAVCMDQEIITVSKISQKEEDNYHMISFICGI